MKHIGTLCRYMRSLVMSVLRSAFTGSSIIHKILILLLTVLRFYWISLNRSKAIVYLMDPTFKQGQCDYFFWCLHEHKGLWDFLYFVTCLDILILIYRHVCTARVMLLHESSYLTSQWIHWRFQVDVIWLLCKGVCLRSGISSIAQTVAV